MKVPRAPAAWIRLPKPLIAMLNTGHTKYITTAKNGMVTVIMIGTKRLPLKKLSAVGSWVWWKRLWMSAVQRPVMIPPNMPIR